MRDTFDRLLGITERWAGGGENHVGGSETRMRTFGACLEIVRIRVSLPPVEARTMSEEVKLGCEQFLDMLQMFAVDHADPATLANPPARIYCALTRQGMLYR